MNTKEIEVTVEVDLDEFTDEELCDELSARGTALGVTQEDLQMLADLIAQGETTEALYLIQARSAGVVNAYCTLKRAELQKQIQGRAT